MKRLLSALILLALVGSAAWANTPDPDACSVSPCDGMDAPRVNGVLNAPTPSNYANLTIYIRNVNGLPINGAFVEVRLETGAGCVTPANAPVLCMCEGTDLTGYTGSDGRVVINAGFGGCCLDIGAAEIIADGVPIRGGNLFYTSPDWDNEKGNCSMGLADFTVFGSGWSTSAAGCTDYDGSNSTGVLDFTIFGGAWLKTCNEAD